MEQKLKLNKTSRNRSSGQLQLASHLDVGEIFLEEGFNEISLCLDMNDVFYQF